MAGGKTDSKKNTEKKKFSRRDFVVGSGTVLAGGALTACTSTTALGATQAAKNPYPLSKGYIVYDSRRCAGCQSCMLACSRSILRKLAPTILQP